MINIQHIIKQLNNSDKEWALKALAVLEDSAMTSDDGADAYGSPEELIRIYQIRLKNNDKNNAVGIEELLDGLKTQPRDAKIFVHPYYTDAYATAAFVDESGKVISCVTKLRDKSNRGERNLDLANGIINND